MAFQNRFIDVTFKVHRLFLETRLLPELSRLRSRYITFCDSMLLSFKIPVPEQIIRLVSDIVTLRLQSCYVTSKSQFCFFYLKCEKINKSDPPKWVTELQNCHKRLGYQRNKFEQVFSELRKKLQKVILQKYIFCPLEKTYKSQSKIILKGIGSLIQWWLSEQTATTTGARSGFRSNCIELCRQCR